MPWSVHKDDRCPVAKPWAVVKDSDDEIEGCHSSEAAAHKQQAALYASEASMIDPIGSHQVPPRDNLVRASFPGAELREAEGGTAPVLFGHFAVFNQ